MTEKESLQVAMQMLDVYAGILFHNQAFAEGNRDTVIYDKDHPCYAQLREIYGLEKIAGKGSDFVRAKRLMHYLAPRLTHSSWYDNHVECNALRLLEYSLNDPDHGINCLNKSKILQECCCAIGIYARRVSIMPYSPYDFDNHVVTEIFDRKLDKWVMLDATTDGYFIDETKTPLSLLQIRERFACGEFVTFVRTGESMKDIYKLREKYAQTNAYICKNLFWFKIERYAGFGEKGEFLWLVPQGFSVKNNLIANAEYRLRNLPAAYEDFRKVWEERRQQAQDGEEYSYTTIDAMTAQPGKQLVD